MKGKAAQAKCQQVKLISFKTAESTEQGSLRCSTR